MQATSRKCPRCDCAMVSDGQFLLCSQSGGSGNTACTYGHDKSIPDALTGMSAAGTAESLLTSVLERAKELEWRLRVTAERIREASQMPVRSLQLVAHEAICVDIEATIDKKWTEGCPESDATHCLQYAIVHHSRVVMATEGMDDGEIRDRAGVGGDVVRFDRCPACEKWTKTSGNLRDIDCPAVVIAKDRVDDQD